VTRDWIEQLVGQAYLEKAGEYNVLHVTERGWRVLHGEEVPTLLKPAEKRVKTSRVAVDSWEGVDHGLFEALRSLRRELAQRKGVPAYVVFSDAALRGMARLRPSTPDALLQVAGVGRVKLEQYGDLFLDAISSYCRENSLSMDVAMPQRASARVGRSTLNLARQTAYGLFARGMSIDEVASAIERVPSTVAEYLISYIMKEGLTDASPWVDKLSFERISDAAATLGTDYIGPIYRALGGEISYEQIKISIAVLKNRGR